MITVTRKNVWNDLKRYYAQLSDYDELQLPLKVEFVDEMAIDEGGPRREFFTLAMTSALNDKNLFSGTPECRIPVRNASAVMSRSFLCFGYLVAMSITQVGLGPAVFGRMGLQLYHKWIVQDNCNSKGYTFK